MNLIGTQIPVDLLIRAFTDDIIDVEGSFTFTFTSPTVAIEVDYEVRVVESHEPRMLGLPEISEVLAKYVEINGLCGVYTDPLTGSALEDVPEEVCDELLCNLQDVMEREYNRHYERMSCLV